MEDKTHDQIAVPLADQASNNDGRDERIIALTAPSNRENSEQKPVALLPLNTDSASHTELATGIPFTSPSPTSIPNVIVFGETGTGKSSLVNMLKGSNIAGVSNQAIGGTFSSQPYDITLNDKLNDKLYRIWDTAGLNEGEHGSVPAEVALENLRTLVGNMSDGINLLVYCVRGTRFREILKFNYDMFSTVICQGKVPIVIVVTGMEHECPMEAWWEANSAEFERYGLEFFDHACVTTTRGKNGMFDEEYEESREKVKELIVGSYRQVPWSVDQERWCGDIVERMQDYQDRYNRKGDIGEVHQAGGIQLERFAVKSWRYVKNVTGEPLEIFRKFWDELVQCYLKFND